MVAGAGAIPGGGLVLTLPAPWDRLRPTFASGEVSGIFAGGEPVRVISIAATKVPRTKEVS